MRLRSGRLTTRYGLVRLVPVLSFLPYAFPKTCPGFAPSSRYHAKRTPQKRYTFHAVLPYPLMCFLSLVLSR
ncbi:hypothetical protein EDB89DRAFT_1964295 [Lactarius sanguifluus]|nr:hypothetical protein EDB89DRAFT_1964295 [Lactarius sanguifluus]